LADRPILQPPAGALPYVGTVDTGWGLWGIPDSFLAGLGNIWNFAAGTINQGLKAAGYVAEGVDAVGSAITEPLFGMSFSDTALALGPLGAEANLALNTIKMLGRTTSIFSYTTTVAASSEGVGVYSAEALAYAQSKVGEYLKTLNTQGLTQVIARSYDAKTGRFIETASTELEQVVAKGRGMIDTAYQARIIFDQAIQEFCNKGK